MPKAPSSSRKRSASRPPRPAAVTESSHALERARRPSGASPEQATRRRQRDDEDRRAAASAGPAGGRSPTSPRAPTRSTTTAMTKSASDVATRTSGRRAARRTSADERARRTRGRTCTLRTECARSVTAKPISRIPSQLIGPPFLTGLAPARRPPARTPSPSARTRWETADGLMPRSSAMSCCRRPLIRPSSTDIDRSDRPVTTWSRDIRAAFTSAGVGPRLALGGDVRRPDRAQRRLALVALDGLDRRPGGPPAGTVLDPRLLGQHEHPPPADALSHVDVGQQRHPQPERRRDGRRRAWRRCPGTRRPGRCAAAPAGAYSALIGVDRLLEPRVHGRAVVAAARADQVADDRH